MNHSLRCMTVSCLFAVLATSCAALNTKDGKDQSAAHRAQAPELSKERLMLSEGYSMLYRDAGTLDLSQLILYVKSESEAMTKIVTAVGEYGNELKKDLERIDRDYPGVRIGQDEGLRH